MRRDLINSEISQLRDLLPLPPSTRQRLSQLQLMALVCVYVRKSNYFQQVLKHQEQTQSETPNIGFSKALNGFIMMMTQGGKLLFISDNAAEYLGHSMEDLLIHGDSVFDIIDKQDHAAVQSELVRGTQPTTPTEEERLFLCRMNVSRNARRQMRFGDQKVVLVQGHYLSYLPLCSRNEPVFLAHCTPVAMPETRECVVQGATNLFTSVHTLDMKFISIDTNGEFYLGYEPTSLVGVSWYHLVHPDNMREVQTKHRLITSSEQDRSCIMLLRLQSASGSWRWVHCVLQVKDSAETPQQTPKTGVGSPPGQGQGQQTSSQQPVIVATNQVLNEKEASVLRANAWLYHYYAMQSKLQYGIAYDAHTQRVHAYYPSVMPYQADHPTHYMTPSLNSGSVHSHPVSHGAPSAYSLAAGAPYLQHYHHPYSVRLHHGFDYSRESTWSNYYDSTATTDHTSSHPYHHHHHHTQQVQQSQQQPELQPQQQQQQQQVHHLHRNSHSQHRTSKKSSPQKTSPRRSPLTPSTPQGGCDTSGGVAVIAPVAVRASAPVASHLKGPSTDLEEIESNTWKSSPTQEVPEYYEYPYITPPYSSTPTKSGSFSFECLDPKESLLKDQRVVPNIEAREVRWSTEASIRSPWLPPEEITGPLRVLNHL